MRGYDNEPGLSAVPSSGAVIIAAVNGMHAWTVTPVHVTGMDGDGDEWDDSRFLVSDGAGRRCCGRDQRDRGRPRLLVVESADGRPHRPARRPRCARRRRCGARRQASTEARPSGRRVRGATRVGHVRRARTAGSETAAIVTATGANTKM